MGSFLMTCGLTNQTIQENEEVVWIPILLMKDSEVDYIHPQTKEVLKYITHSTVCYKTDRYKPLGFAMYGKLEDCGFINFNYKDSANKLMFKQFLDYLRENFVTIQNPDCSFITGNKTFDVNNKEYDKNLELFYDDLFHYYHRNPLLVINRQLEPCEVYFYLVKKSSYDFLIELDNQELLKTYQQHLTYKWYRDNVERLYKAQLEISSLKNQFNTLIELYKQEKELYTTQNSEDTRVSFLFKRHEITDIIFRPNSGITTLGDHYVYNVLYEDPSENSYPYFERVMNLKQYLHGLSLCNASPKPVEYGSQDYSNTSGLKFAQLIKQANLESLKFSYEQYLEYGDYDPDAEEGSENALKSFEDFCKDFIKE